MSKSLLLKTNTAVCVIIAVGFAIVSAIGYSANTKLFKRDVAHVALLASEGIYYQIDAIFTKPVNVSLTMANDTLLKTFLRQELAHSDDAAYVERMREYLDSYRQKYGYDSVFLVSTKTDRYYHFNGIDRILTPGNPENTWYFDFVSARTEYALNIDNDEAAGDEITVFVNCAITDEDGGVMGVVGVGFKVDAIQQLLLEYLRDFGVRTYLLDVDGTIELAPDRTGYHRENFFDGTAYDGMREQIAPATHDGVTRAFWHPEERKAAFVVTRYIPTLSWYLVLENDTDELQKTLRSQFGQEVTIIVMVTIFLLLLITRVIRGYNKRIVDLTISHERRYRAIFKEETGKLFENICEFDITNNRTAGESAEQYFAEAGLAPNEPYDSAMRAIAEKYVKEEFRDEYLDLFSRENLIRTHESGMSSVSFDYMETRDGTSYHWKRLTARVFFWNEDNSIRMFAYRQNIDPQKRKEERMLDQMQRDPLTGLYNKATTQDIVRRLLEENPDKPFAFFILDIDNFKQINDRCGHAVGDEAIVRFATLILSRFRDSDVVGRIGGDEFAVFLPVPDRRWVERKAADLVAALCTVNTSGPHAYKLSASVGIAISPDAGTTFETLYKKADAALYIVKEHGRNGFEIYDGV